MSKSNILIRIKKLLLAFLVIAVIFSATACKKNNENQVHINDLQVSIINEEQNDTEQAINIAEKQAMSEKQDKPEGDGEGNKYNNESNKQIMEIGILVSENEYFIITHPLNLTT